VVIVTALKAISKLSLMTINYILLSSLQLMQTIKIFRQLNRKKLIKNTDRFLIEQLDKGMKKVKKLTVIMN
jgi:hypothetical protein